MAARASMVKGSGLLLIDSGLSLGWGRAPSASGAWNLLGVWLFGA